MDELKKVLKRAASYVLALTMVLTITGLYLGSNATTAKADETTSATDSSESNLKLAYVTDSDGVMHVFNTDQDEPSSDGTVTSKSGKTYTPKENSRYYAYITSTGITDVDMFQRITGHGEYDNYNDSYSEVKSVDIEADTKAIPNMNDAFWNLENVTSINIENLDTSKVTDMGGMFYDCSSLTALDLSKFDTSKVTNMEAMFEGCSSLTALDLSKFDTSEVTNMVSMFDDCSSLTTLDLSKFDTSKVTDMHDMFSGCRLLATLDLSNLDTSKVTDMDNMFSGCSSLLAKNKIIKIGKKTYVANNEGDFAENEIVKLPNGKKVIADKNGLLVKNKVVKIGSKYYCSDKKGYLVTKSKKIVKIGKYKYITKKNGSVYTNTTVKIGKKTYKVNKKGQIVK